MRKTIIATLVVTLIIAMTPTALATQTLGCWWSLNSYVLYNPYDGSYCIYNHSSDNNSSAKFKGALSNAEAQWNNVLPIGISERSVSYALSQIYFGTYSQLIDRFPSLTSNLNGLTAVPYDTEPTIVTFRGVSKGVYKTTSGGTTCVVQKSGKTEADYTNTALHEMGHLFGWSGHSYIETDVMWETANGVTTLTERDINHLKQIYDLFY